MCFYLDSTPSNNEVPTAMGSAIKITEAASTCDTPHVFPCKII